MNDGTGAEEQAGLEHGVGEQVEHTGHVTELGVIVEHAFTTMGGKRGAEGNHHEGNLGNRREGQHALDVALRAGDRGGIEGGDCTNPHDNGKGGGSILHPHGEHARNLEHTGHDHRRSVDEGRHGGGAFHGIGQPNVEGEHGTLTGAADKHQHQRGRDDKRACCHRGIDSDIEEGRGMGSQLHRSGEREVERVREVAEHENADKEEHIGKARHDEGFLRGGDSGRRGVVETNEEVGRYAHQFPEHIHLENVGGEHQTEHRHGEEAQVGIIALESALAVHIAEGVDVHHERHGGNHHEHHHRDGIEENTEVKMERTEGQPREIVGNNRGKGAVGQTLSGEILESCDVGQHRYGRQ